MESGREGSSTASSETNSSKHAETVLRHLKGLVATQNQVQSQMGKLLIEVKGRRYWKRAGHSSFRKYVQRELSLSVRKAQMLMSVYDKFVNQVGFPEERLEELPWSKAALVTKQLTKENLQETLNDLKNLSHAELRSKHRSKNGEAKVNSPFSGYKRSPATLGANQSPAWILPRPPEDDHYVSEENWIQLCYALFSGENVLLLGPSGCGKSELISLLTRMGKRPRCDVNCGAMSDPRSTLIGNTHYSPEKGTWFAKSRFVKAIEQPGTCILLDELSRAPREAFNVLLPLLDGQAYLALDEMEDAGVVRRAEGVSFFATANVGMEYVGADRLDKALKDRFSIIVDLGFPPVDKEVAVLVKRCQISEEQANLLVSFADRQRQLAREGEFAEMVSTRALLAAGRQVHAGIPPKAALRYCVLNSFSAEGGDLSEQAKLAQLLQKNG